MKVYLKYLQCILLIICMMQIICSCQDVATQTIKSVAQGIIGEMTDARETMTSEEDDKRSCKSECDEESIIKLKDTGNSNDFKPWLHRNNFQYCTKEATSEITSMQKIFYNYDAHYCAKHCYPTYCLPCKEKWCASWCSQVKTSLDKCKNTSKGT